MTRSLLVAVLVLTAVSLLNLGLLLGVVRRIREQEARLSGARFDPPAVMVPVGHRVGEFTTRSADGKPVASTMLTAPTLVGFLAPGCRACHQRLPEFRRAVAAHPGSALAVVVRDGGDTEPLVAGLDGAAIVVIEDMGGPLTRAFNVRGFPAFALLSADGTVQAQGVQLPLRPTTRPTSR